MPFNPLKFETAKELAESTPEEPEFYVQGILIKGAITSFSAKIKAGKTTMMGHVLRAVVTNDTFIDLLTRRTKVLYCTEEGQATFKSFLVRTHLDESEDIEVLRKGTVPQSIGWHDVVQFVFSRALEINAGIVIFDTLTRWANIAPDKENDPGTAAAAMQPLEILRDNGIAVMAVFHDRKSGGDVGDSQRGSSAFGGAADILLQLERPGTTGHSNRRVLHQLGRFNDPTDWVMDLQEGVYHLVGQASDLKVERNSYKMRIVGRLDDCIQPQTKKEIAKALDISPDSNTLSRALEELTNEGHVAKSGEGHRHDPFRYCLVSISSSLQLSEWVGG